MREKDSNTSIELSIVMINLRPPTFSDLHPTTAHAKPPPLLLPSPSHSLCIPVTLPSRSPPLVWCNPLPTQSAFLPFRHKESASVVAARGLGGGWVAEEQGGLEVSWMCQSLLPLLRGHTQDKYQISLTTAVVHSTGVGTGEGAWQGYWHWSAPCWQ